MDKNVWDSFFCVGWVERGGGGGGGRGGRVLNNNWPNILHVRMDIWQIGILLKKFITRNYIVIISEISKQALIEVCLNIYILERRHIGTGIQLWLKILSNSLSYVLSQEIYLNSCLSNRFVKIITPLIQSRGLTIIIGIVI